MNECRPNKAGVFPCLTNNLILGQCAIVQVPLGNMTQYRILVARTLQGLFIAVETKGAYEFSGFAHQGYVQEKLNLKFEGDAANIADFINDQLQNNSKRQGQYNGELCRE